MKAPARGDRDFPPLPASSTARRGSESSRIESAGVRRDTGNPGPVNRPRVARRKVAVVTIMSKAGTESSYAEILGAARRNISLNDIGIKETRIRPAFNGGYKIEVPGERGLELAGRLKEQLKVILQDVAKVDNPVAKGELKIVGLAPSTLREEIGDQLTCISSFPPESFNISDIKRMRDGMGIAWVQCPLNAAISIAEIGRLRIGWTSAKVELLKKRAVQCFKCWRFGHVRTNCSAPEDRFGSCFRCGNKEHKAKDCSAPLHCVVCSDLGKNCNHRIGSYPCLVNNGYETIKRVEQKQPERSFGYAN
ncbi:uncharacterized protein LOC114932883 [Nylanderia fulva]|uniref:uncharacterized protein LOC114932883 n=1 Tax=Nylanderia fulva TaxID=613905 RepID=UPI0010FB8B54|nr:uncharacterized protein LOC114932883 [Nylanderia fulva]